ncbi:FAD:protein FMN transferase [Thalassoroseus pseudoceratinae]|uniref:FAD:protein FMN transferase n=1 Tax=Thalassoroseus pseudoceratinae TaxID=2713176 RepID=UPI001421B928|nr:FAD:protein FMN transferase [Thalassoroseus pseudoceratinae]
MTDSAPNRRDFLAGRAARDELRRHGEKIADDLHTDSPESPEPSAGSTIRVAATAMACEFAVLLNSDDGKPHARSTAEAWAASDVLDLVHQLEDQMTVYRDDSELAEINRNAPTQAVRVESNLFRLLCQARDISHETEHAFDPTSGPCIALWRTCRQENRLPTEPEIQSCLERSGIDKIQFDESGETVRYLNANVELNLGGIGKGYALDVVAEELTEQGFESFLVSGGHSSLIARGEHNGHPGWPVGIRNPMFPTERLATILLCDGALSTSGSGVQHFRHEGKRYGHIIDPRTGWPVDELVSVTVLAPTAAEADALSTAFFVLGLEKTQAYCDNRPDVGAWLIPSPRRGRALRPVRCNLPDELLFLNPTGSVTDSE